MLSAGVHQDFPDAPLHVFLIFPYGLDSGCILLFRIVSFRYMEIVQKQHERRIIFCLKGELMGSAISNFMKEVELAKENAECDEVWIDMGQISNIESKGFGAAIYVHRILRKVNKRVVFLMFNRMREFFSLVNLDKELNIISLDDILSPEQVSAPKSPAE